jgi:hypothetical protein
MSKAFSHRLSRKLFTLSLLVVCLVFLSIGPGVNADETCCSNQYNSCMSNCGFNTTCQAMCYDQYTYCSGSGGVGCGPAQPQTPCEECLANCDDMHADCLASGTQTPQQCAYMSYRCRQRCNLYCIY